MPEPKILIHGGAWDIPPGLHNDHLQGITTALEAGLRALRSGMNATGIVKTVISELENNPVFDAGYGSFLNEAGEVEMDAGIMSGTDLSVGAVAAIRNVAHPILVADHIRLNTQHCLLAGSGAAEYAFRNGFERVETIDLLTDREKKLYAHLKSRNHLRIKSFFELRKTGRDTVGAAVLDRDGNFAAGTSTGGTPLKMSGRVGDSPLPGAGYYADNRFGAVSVTGWGEGIMRVLLANKVIDLISAGQSADHAAGNAIRDLHERVQGDAGLIAVDKNGRIGVAYNTPFMAFGLADSSGIIETGIDNKSLRIEF